MRPAALQPEEVLQQFTVSQLDAAGAAGGATQSARVDAGDDGAGPDDDELRPNGQCHLYGRVVDGDGNPVAGARLEAWPALDETAFPGLDPPGALVHGRSGRSGDFLLSFPAPRLGGVRVALTDRVGTRHVSSVITAEPWEVVLLPDLRTSPRRDVLIRVHRTPVAGMPDRPAFAWLLPKPPETPVGPAPLLIDERGLPLRGRPGRWREAAGGTIGIEGIGDGDWRIVVFCEGRRPVLVGTEARESEVELVPLVTRRIDADARDLVLVAIEPPDRLPRLAWTTRNGALIVEHGLLEAAGATLLVPGAAVPLGLDPDGRLITPAWGWGRRTPSDATEFVGLAAAGPDAEPRDFLSLALAAPEATTLRSGWAIGRYAPLWSTTEHGTWRGPAIEIVAGQTAGLMTPGEPPPSRTIEGSVRDAESGEGIAGTLVAIGRGFDALPEERLPYLLRASAGGSFVESGFPPGDLEVVTSSPTHAPSRTIARIPAATGSTTRLELPIGRGGSARISVTDPNGHPLSELALTVVAPLGRHFESRTDAAGIARFPHLAPGPWALLATPGRLSVPLDSWDWIVAESGAASLTIAAGEETLLEWRVPAPIRWRSGIRFENVTGLATLQIVHVGVPPAPGIWPDLMLGPVKQGGLEIDRMFPGRYRAVATQGHRVELVDFEVSERNSPEILIFPFSRE